MEMKIVEVEIDFLIIGLADKMKNNFKNKIVIP